MAAKLVTPHASVDAVVSGYFREGPGYYAWRPRGTDDYLLIYTVAGRGRFGTADGREHRAGRDDVYLIAPGTFQDYSAETSTRRWNLLWAHFKARAEWLDLLNWPAIEPGMFRLSLAGHPLRDEVLGAFRRVHDRSLMPDALRDRLVINAMEALLLSCIRASPSRGGRTRIDAHIRQTMDHISTHLDQALTLAALAEVSGMSASRLGHLFRAAVGISPMAYVERQRVQRAKELLAMTSLSIKQISRRLGFSTQFYFSLRFKRATGTAPSMFRSRVPPPYPG